MTFINFGINCLFSLKDLMIINFLMKRIKRENQPPIQHNIDCNDESRLRDVGNRYESTDERYLGDLSRQWTPIEEKNLQYLLRCSYSSISADKSSQNSFNHRKETSRILPAEIFNQKQSPDQEKVNHLTKKLLNKQIQIEEEPMPQISKDEKQKRKSAELRINKGKFSAKISAQYRSHQPKVFFHMRDDLQLQGKQKIYFEVCDSQDIKLKIKMRK